MIILSESDIERVLKMDDCLRVLEETFRDFGLGHAVNRPRTHAYSWLEPGTFYLFKSMDGGIPRYGVHALRITSDIVQTQQLYQHTRDEKLARAPGGRFVGLVLLFDMTTGEPLAILQDAGLQRMRVGATSALAAKYIAREDACRIGMFGTGWQSRPQLEALARVRKLKHVKVHSLNPDHRRRFAAEMSDVLGIPVVAVEEPREVVRGADIVVCATNAQEPVFKGAWLEPGQHVNSLQSGELDEETHRRADVMVVRAFEKSRHYVAKDAPEIPTHTRMAHRFHEGFEDKSVDLGGLIAGLKQGRRDARAITLFGGSGTGPSSGLGIQFAAVGKLAYDLARAAKLGREIPTEWLTEEHHP